MAMRGYRRRIKSRLRRFRRRARRGPRRGLVRLVKRIAYSIPEKKYFDFAFNLSDGGYNANPPVFAGLTSATLSGSWANQISLVNAIPQGNGEGQRIGNRIHVRYVQFFLLFCFSNISTTTQIQPSVNANINGMICRYMMLLDKQPAQTTLPRQAMEDPGTFNWTPFAGALAVTVYTGRTSALRDYNQLRRYKVLVDLQHQSYLTAATVPAGTNSQAPMTGNHVAQHYVPINRDFTYANTSAVINGASVMIDNDILLQACPSDASCCTVYGLARVCYNDS